jgi:hypothetical protein
MSREEKRSRFSNPQPENPYAHPQHPLTQKRRGESFLGAAAPSLACERSSNERGSGIRALLPRFSCQFGRAFPAFILLVALFTGLPTPLFAQTAGQVRIKNNTDEELTIELDYFIDENGKEVIDNNKYWVCKPQTHTSLFDDGKPFRVKEFRYKVTTQHGTTPEPGKVWVAKYTSGQFLDIEINPKDLPVPTAGQVCIRNKTNETLTIELGGYYVDENGKEIYDTVTWKCKPKTSTNLLYDGKPFRVREFHYRVATQHGTVPAPGKVWVAKYTSGKFLEITINPEDLPDKFEAVMKKLIILSREMHQILTTVKDKKTAEDALPRLDAYYDQALELEKTLGPQMDAEERLAALTKKYQPEIDAVSKLIEDEYKRLSKVPQVVDVLKKQKAVRAIEELVEKR